MKTTGILGGSFNPPHLGHLQTATAAHDALGLDEVWIWVSHNIFKDPASYVPLEDRKAMVELLAGGQPWLKATDAEKDFPDSLTANALTLLQAMYPDRRFVWILGDDNFASFHTWDRAAFQKDGRVIPDWQYILDNFSVAVVNRPGFHAAALDSEAAAYAANLFAQDADAFARNGNGWTMVGGQPFEESSTHIKQQLLAGARPIGGLAPAVEAYIYEHGLFGARSDFNHVGRPMQPASGIRLEVFLLLAHTANFIKAAGLANATFDAPDLMSHAASCWDKSAGKGDFARPSEVAGELADNLISLYWVADAQGISLPGRDAENQKSVARWCDVHYPDTNVLARLKDYLEELTELCVCEGVERGRFLNLLRPIFEDQDCDDIAASCGKTFAALQACAAAIDRSLPSILDEKMASNRRRTPEQSAARLQTKKRSMEPQ